MALAFLVLGLGYEYEAALEIVQRHGPTTLDNFRDPCGLLDACKAARRPELPPPPPVLAVVPRAPAFPPPANILTRRIVDAVVKEAATMAAEAAAQSTRALEALAPALASRMQPPIPKRRPGVALKVAFGAPDPLGQGALYLHSLLCGGTSDIRVIRHSSTFRLPSGCEGNATSPSCVRLACPSPPPPPPPIHQTGEGTVALAALGPG